GRLERPSRRAIQDGHLLALAERPDRREVVLHVDATAIGHSHAPGRGVDLIVWSAHPDVQSRTAICSRSPSARTAARSYCTSTPPPSVTRTRQVAASI